MAVLARPENLFEGHSPTRAALALNWQRHDYAPCCVRGIIGGGMRNVRSRRRAVVDLRRIMIGDYIVLVAGFMTLISLFMPWFVSSIGPSRTQNAFAYSPLFSTIVIVFFLATIFLVLYPAVAPEFGLPLLPFSTPLVFMALGGILLLMVMYEMGKYACISCTTVSRGYGVWLALVASCVYLVGAIIKWGSRPVRRTPGGESLGRA